jgi:Peptidase family M28
MTFDEILDTLVVPRGNGSAALGEAGAYIEKALRATGATVSLHEFVCRPYEIYLSGLVTLTLALAFMWLMWRRRFGWALLISVLLPAYLFVVYELHFPLLGRIASTPEHNIVASFPVEEPLRTVILGAHYDTRTDLLSYYRQLPFRFLIVEIAVLTVCFPLTGLWRRWRGRPEGHVRGWAAIVPLYYVGFFLTVTGGAFVSARSAGALDDAGAVAALLQVAAKLGAGEPRLEHTQVEIIFFSGEEVGLQGSRSYVAEQLATPPAHPTYFINAEGWGFGPDLTYFLYERTPWRRYEASTLLVRALDHAYRELHPQVGLLPNVQPVTSDARSFQLAGIASVTLGSQGPGDDRLRFLHSPSDTRARLQQESLADAVIFVQMALADIDVNGVTGEGS